LIEILPALQTIALLCAVMFGIGLVVGFIGAGGAGIAVAILTTVFALPVHTAIGTAMLAMFFVTLSGAASHYREGNVAPRLGIVVGLCGALGAILGADSSQSIPDRTLGVAAGLALWALAFMVWLRTHLKLSVASDAEWQGEPARAPREWAAGAGLGAVGGVAAAFFGVGMAPFLQLGFLVVNRLPLRLAIGTTMLALVSISGAGGFAMARHGDVSLLHLAGLVLGLASGAFVGARFTRRAPRALLRVAVIATPVVAGAMLLFL
jgi:uncharacterized membrane protein YfcA